MHWQTEIKWEQQQNVIYYCRFAFVIIFSVFYFFSASSVAGYRKRISLDVKQSHQRLAATPIRRSTRNNSSGLLRCVKRLQEQ